MATKKAGDWPVVYFIEAVGCDLIKIGVTRHMMWDRLRQIRSGSPVPVTVIGIIEGDAAIERQLHLRFRDLWSHGEWFRKADELTAYIAVTAKPWVEYRLNAPRSLVDPDRLPDGSLPTSPGRALREWAEATSLVYFGQTRSIAEWSDIMGWSVRRIKGRLEAGVIPANLFLYGETLSPVPSPFAPRPPRAAVAKPPVVPVRRPVVSHPAPPKRYGPLQSLLDAAREEPTP
jgi:hypothetical protein